MDSFNAVNSNSQDIDLVTSKLLCFLRINFFFNEYYIKDRIDEQTEKSLTKLLFDHRTRLVKEIAQRDSLFCSTAMLFRAGRFPRKRYLYS